MQAPAVVPASKAFFKVVAVFKACSWISAEGSRSAHAGEHLNGPGHLFRRLHLHFIVWSGIRNPYLEENWSVSGMRLW